VKTYVRAIALGCVMNAMCAGNVIAEEATSSEVPIDRDLAAVIALQGLPCGKVVSATQAGEDDYIASCQDGNRYRVYVNADGRVVVEKLD